MKDVSNDFMIIIPFLSKGGHAYAFIPKDNLAETETLFMQGIGKHWNRVRDCECNECRRPSPKTLLLQKTLRRAYDICTKNGTSTHLMKTLKYSEMEGG